MNITDKDILTLIANQIKDEETWNNFALCNKKTYNIFKKLDPDKYFKTICLVMIITNYDENILPCLESVYKHIDTYVIYLRSEYENIINIRDFFASKGIVGQFIHRESQNIHDFGLVKTNAFKFAQTRADYILCIEPNYIIKTPENINLRKVVGDKDVYNFKNSRYIRYLSLFKSKLEWVFGGSFLTYKGRTICDLKNGFKLIQNI